MDSIFLQSGDFYILFLFYIYVVIVQWFNKFEIESENNQLTNTTTGDVVEWIRR